MHKLSCLKLLFIFAVSALVSPAFAQHHHHNNSSTSASNPAASAPWMNRNLSPDQRADMVLQQMTLDEKIDLLHGQGMLGWEGKPMPNAYLSNGGAGFVLGVPRLGIPMIQMDDAAYGVRFSARNGRYSTAMPSNLGSAASWDPRAACEYGGVIGRELHAQGYNMSLGGGVDLVRQLRGGRTFEYMGEDPILAGTMVGNRIKCEQAAHVISDIKHYAMNDQESGRNEYNAIIGKRAMQESDLLAFQIGMSIGHPGAVMCSYNAVNGDYSCENKYLLTDVLKDEWKFPGFVLSDWGGTHSTVKASAAGLDNEEPLDTFYGPKMKEAVQSGVVSMSQLNDHVHRILRSEFAAGIIDDPAQKSVVEAERDLKIALHVEENSIVLLKNSHTLLPLDPAKIHSIAVIGSHADVGMISGGGSAQVDPPGSTNPAWQSHVWFPPSPLKAVTAMAPSATVKFDSGTDPAAAAALAGRSDVAVVFVSQWSSEGMDLPSLSLPDNQDALIDQVSAANPRTVVVLETSTAVLMPWIEKVGAVVEAWYAGSDGAPAVANVLFGDVNPSGKLPITFPLAEADQPPPQIVVPPPGAQGKAAVMRTGVAKPTFDVHYTEGLNVGYKWYQSQHKPVLFPFGFGLSYTTFSYSGLQVEAGDTPTVTFTVKNTGDRAAEEIAEVYAGLPASANEPPKRLVGWSKVHLNVGESKRVRIAIPQLYLSVYDEQQSAWKLVPGSYSFMVGGSSADLPLVRQVNLSGNTGAIGQ